jgi:hypothetical protein
MLNRKSDDSRGKCLYLLLYVTIIYSQYEPEIPAHKSVWYIIKVSGSNDFI